MGFSRRGTVGLHAFMCTLNSAVRRTTGLRVLRFDSQLPINSDAVDCIISALFHRRTEVDLERISAACPTQSHCCSTTK